MSFFMLMPHGFSCYGAELQLEVGYGGASALLFMLGVEDTETNSHGTVI